LRTFSFEHEQQIIAMIAGFQEEKSKFSHSQGSLK